MRRTVATPLVIGGILLVVWALVELPVAIGRVIVDVRDPDRAGGLRAIVIPMWQVVAKFILGVIAIVVAWHLRRPGTTNASR